MPSNSNHDDKATTGHVIAAQNLITRIRWILYLGFGGRGTQLCIHFSPAVLKPTSSLSLAWSFSRKFAFSAIGVDLASTEVMAHLHLVKSNGSKQDTPRRGRGSAVSSERRYRYPAEEIWQVSDDRWQVAERRYLPQESRPKS